MDFLKIVTIADQEFPLRTKSHGGLDVHSQLCTYEACLASLPPRNACGETCVLFLQRSDYHDTVYRLCVFDNRTGTEIANLRIGRDWTCTASVLGKLVVSPLTQAAWGWLLGAYAIARSDKQNRLVELPAWIGSQLSEWLDGNGLPSVWGYRLPELSEVRS